LDRRWSVVRAVPTRLRPPLRRAGRWSIGTSWGDAAGRPVGRSALAGRVTPRHRQGRGRRRMERRPQHPGSDSADGILLTPRSGRRILKTVVGGRRERGHCRRCAPGPCAQGRSPPLSKCPDWRRDLRAREHGKMKNVDLTLFSLVAIVPILVCVSCRGPSSAEDTTALGAQGGQSRNREVAGLLGFLTDRPTAHSIQEHRWRRDAIRQLGEIGDPEAVDVLLDIVEAEVPSGSVLDLWHLVEQDEAIRALGLIGDRRALGVLCRLRDARLRSHGKHALVLATRRSDLLDWAIARCQGQKPAGEERGRESRGSSPHR